MTKRPSLLVSLILSLLTLFSTANEEGWEALFNGTDLTGWRGYQMETAPEGWTVKDGILGCSGEGRVDLITTEQYENFELWLEWKTEPNGNSGILLLGDEAPKKMWNHAPEVQLFDAGSKKTAPEHQAGAIYALYPTKLEAIKPAREWIDMRIKIQDRKLRITLNGVEVCAATLGSDDWNARVAASKFNKFEQFGKNTKGHIGLQDHGQKVWFKTIKLRKL